MQVEVPDGEAEAFRRQLATDEFRDAERDYKVAVHVVLASLFGEGNKHRADFGDLIADLFSETMPDMDRLGMSPEDQAFVREALGGGGLRGAMANLAGGKWGLAQFSWIPRAVEFGLGAEVAEAFRRLVDEAEPLAERVERFRDDFDEISVALERKGGFLPNWQHIRESLAFIAVVLTGFDPSRYTFYSQGALLYGYQHYAPGREWPKGSRGAVYEDVCDFVRSVAAQLRAKGVPIQDLIDAQSFIWTRFNDAKQADAKEGPASGPSTVEAGDTGLDADAIVKELAKVVYWPEDRARNLVRLVQRSGQLIFQGPPGTGKTFLAETLARLLVGEAEGRVEVVQFHPSYAYEDFVEGIRPRVTEGSDLAFEVRKGIFLRIAEDAKRNPDDAFFLVIDELNRANLSRVLGELLYALEYRGSQHGFRLPYSGIETYIPSNITIIGTMNTADRSIALVDAAIRRRFRHFGFAPDSSVLAAWLTDHGHAAVASTAATKLTALNDRLSELLDADRLIGHAYLMRDDLEGDGFRAAWEEDIEPVLREHLFNQPDEISTARQTFLGTE